MASVVTDNDVLDAVSRVGDYLPIFPRSEDDARYLGVQLSLLEKSCEVGLYQAASLHLHLLYMSVVYYQIFRIKESCPHDYTLACTYGHDRKTIENATSPYGLSTMKESEAFEFYRVLNVPPETISNLKQCVRKRNELVHANPANAVPDLTSFMRTLEMYLTDMQKSVALEEGLLLKLYQDFELGFVGGRRQYEDASDEVRESFIKANFLSRCEIAALLPSSRHRRGRSEVLQLLTEFLET
jgi:hypothetical protein